jgi:hypothetical protein
LLRAFRDQFFATQTSWWLSFKKSDRNAECSSTKMIPKCVQIAMSLRDTTTDENELAMGYTVPRSDCTEVGA